MFYLVAGVPRSGKSTFSKILSQKLGIARIDFDDITTLFQEFIPDYGLCMEMNQLEREKKSLPIMASLIKRYIRTNESLIIEGDNINLNDYNFYNKLTNGKLKILVFGYKDLTPENKIAINTAAVNKKDITCWFENIEEYSDKLRIAQEFIERSKMLYKQVEILGSSNNVRYFDTHTNDFEKEIEKAMNFCK